MLQDTQPNPSSSPTAARPPKPMTATKRFFIGASGALLPLLVTLIAFDAAPLIDHPENLTLGICLGAFIRYVALFVLGGVVAALNSRETRPITLVQLGISAPALVSSFVNAQAVNATRPIFPPPPVVTAPAQRTGMSLSLIASASASQRLPAPHGPKSSPIVPADFLSDIIKGATNTIPGALALVDTVQIGSNNIGLYQCERKGDVVIVCLLLVTRSVAGVDSLKASFQAQLVDNLMINHALMYAYFIDGQGQKQNTARLGKADWVWLVLEFAGPSKDVTSARIEFQDPHSRAELRGPVIHSQ